MSTSLKSALKALTTLCLALTLAGPTWATVQPERSSPVAGKESRHPDLDVRNRFLRPAELPPQAAAQARADLAALGVPEDAARLDQRGGAWAALWPNHPLLPGTGVGNSLTWEKLGLWTPVGKAALENVAGRAFLGFVAAHRQALRIDPAELGEATVTAHGDGEVIQVHVPRTVGGVPVRGSYLHAVINHGNLVLFGATHWGRVNTTGPPAPRLLPEQAVDAARAHLSPIDAGAWSKPELVLLPMTRGRDLDGVAVGRGFNYRLAWSLLPTIDDEDGTWETLVDATTGEVLAFEDRNLYAEAQGGVLPVSNDGVPPEGVEQADWPMPYDVISTASGNVTADSGGNFIPSGTNTSTLSGQYIRMNDGCGPISLSSTGDVDFGTSDGADCTTPGFGGDGNTHASRTGFHELNRIAEMARGQLPANAWLQDQLTANMNINSTCNAFWNGSTVNFYRSGGGCSNTGELAGVFDHEWGHGMDANDATPGVSSPGEGIADLYTALRLNDSCVGHNFRPGVPCGGYGDPCTHCTGVRDIDWANRQSGVPHDYTWAQGVCGASVHCYGFVYSEAVWDLWKRDLRSPPYDMDNNTAMELVTRLTYLGAGGVGTWFAGGPPNGGCAATSGYQNYLAADDDNGDLGDGTPHMDAIFAAFDRHEIACTTPTVQVSGCADTPTTAPVVTATPLDKSAHLTWNAVAGASKYQVFRTDGVFACDFGKVKLGETADTSWTDSGLRNGRRASYVVIPVGAADTCLGPASSCASVTPASGPNLDVDVGSAVLALANGDGDAFLDNCETGTLTFDVMNTGLGALTNVRITGVTPVSHPSIAITTPFPAAVSPSNLGAGASASGSFSFTADGLSFEDTVVFQVDVTADELTVAKSQSLTVLGAETDLRFFASHTFTFESGNDGWQTLRGTFDRSSSGGAQGTTWYEASSADLDYQCDHVRSPVFQLHPTSTLALWNQFDIEPQYSNGVWYDRANVGIHEVASGLRTPVNPSGGRLYNASGPQGTCGTTGQDGWADAATTWGKSTWDAAALGSAGFAGQPVQLDVRYGTDFILNGFGFHFDQVTLTDVDVLVADTRSDLCVTDCTSDAECDDGLSCNGAETCNTGTGLCQPGPPPDCDDGVGCTVDTCNEGADSCDHTPSDTFCDNGLFCDGAETCDPVLDCRPGTDPCDEGLSCDEVGDFCITDEQAITVLVYDHDTHQHYAQQAANNLSLFVTVAGAGDFNTLLSSGEWDLVMVDCPNTIPSEGWSDLVDFVSGGGLTVMSFWDWDNDSGFGDPALFSAFGFNTATSVSLLDTVSTLVAADTIAGGTVFADVPGMPHSSWSNGWYDDGDAFTFSGGQAIASFASRPGPVTIVNAGGNAIATFLVDEWRGEGAVELWEGMAKLLPFEVIPPFFSDGFESGDTSNWSVTLP